MPYFLSRWISLILVIIWLLLILDKSTLSNQYVLTKINHTNINNIKIFKHYSLAQDSDTGVVGGEFPQLTSILKKVIFQGRENFLLCTISQTKWCLHKDYLITNVNYTYGLVDT